MRHLSALLLLLLSACATTGQSLYQELGGQPKIEQIVDNFIVEIEYSPIMFSYFKDSDILRFRSKMIEHLCALTGGPCDYTGDTMIQVHTGMNITESDFNHGVDLFIDAMTKADVPHPVQNKVLSVMAPERRDIIYL